jgi:hypothetical protein
VGIFTALLFKEGYEVQLFDPTLYPEEDEVSSDDAKQEAVQKVLKKTFDDRVLIRAINLIADAQAPLTVNNMIGSPGETRDLVFDTIELNRKLVTDSINCSVVSLRVGGEN